MRALGSYVDEAVRSLKADKAIEIHRLKDAWLKAVGPILASQSEPTKIRGAVLYVTVSSPAWSQEIQFQQKLILGRLKTMLRSSPTKIACWVGEPHVAPVQSKQSSAKNEREVVPWFDVAVPEARQAVIETHVAGLEDDGIRAKVRALMELSVKREIYLLEKGLLPCPICGSMRDPELEICEECYRERMLRAERRILQAFAKRPWLKVRDIQDSAPWAGRALVIRLKKLLRTDLLQQAWQLAEGTEGGELSAKMTPAFRKLLLDITMLTCSLPEDSLKPRHFGYALGKRLAQGYSGLPNPNEASQGD